ncbi:hypothetical protein GCM10009865_47480 [Aeromicrobium ponti]|uniref:Uncharacterized protein n=1 Tax=Cytobacillus oceanisediminis TaxID=665099 RepID=A0A562JCY8_9BACI|nr:hypothetical protein [Cytobacillus oceanisediminis]TWH81009.1 hypothetical protein IQ19_04426 [Cytobacillus oceanisediminis]
MEKYKVVLEFVNGNKKAIDIDHDSYLEFDKSVRENVAWFKYGGVNINLKNVCYYSFCLNDDKEPSIDEQINNEAQALMDWN